MAQIPQIYKNAVVSIGVKIQDNNIAWIGTGFFMIRVVDGYKHPFLISNKHVFQGQKTIVIRMKEKGTENLKEIEAAIIRLRQLHYTLICQ